MLLVPQPRLFSGLPWTRAVRLNVDRGKPFTPPASRGWYAPARSPARQRRGSGRFHCPPGGVRLLRGFPLCVTGAPAVRRAAIPAVGCPLSRILPLAWVPLSRGALYPGIPPQSQVVLCRDTRSIPGVMSSMPGYPLYPGVPSVPVYPPCRGTLCPGVFPLSGYSLCPEVPSMPGYPLHPGVPALGTGALVCI